MPSISTARNRNGRQADAMITSAESLSCGKMRRRPGGGARDAFDVDAVIRQEMIEHAPGEGSMRAAALQAEIDLLGRGSGCSDVITLGAYQRMTAHFSVIVPSSRRRS